MGWAGPMGQEEGIEKACETHVTKRRERNGSGKVSTGTWSQKGAVRLDESKEGNLGVVGQ